MGYGNAVIFKRAESNRKHRICRRVPCIYIYLYTRVNIGQVYVMTPPLSRNYHLPAGDHLSRVKAETRTTVGTDSIMRLVSTKPFIHLSAFLLVHLLSSKFSLLSFSFYTYYFRYRSFLISSFYGGGLRRYIRAVQSDSAARIIYPSDKCKVISIKKKSDNIYVYL